MPATPRAAVFPSTTTPPALEAALRAELETRGVALVRPPDQGDPTGGERGEVLPTHVFVLDAVGGELEALLRTAGRWRPPPRVVLLSSMAQNPADRAAEAALRAAGLPFTIARAHPPGAADRGARRALARALVPPARLLGLARFAGRHAPFDPAELAYGLVHAGLNYTTIDRVVLAEELRWEIANDRPFDPPRSRRDELRH